MLKKIRQYYSKKSRWSIASDIFFALLIISLLFPPSRQFVLVGIKKLTMFGPGIEKPDNRQSLSRSDYNWRLVDRQGNKHKLKDYRGKVVFLNFWATWCPPCIAEMPSIQKLYDLYKNDKSVEFILVTNEDNKVIEAFMSKAGYTMPVYHNLEPAPYIISSPSIPKTFIISPDGEIVVSKTGSARWHGDKIVELIDSLKEQKK